MLCPVDLVACDRPDCRGGHCTRADSACVFVCWTCGGVEERVVDGVCVSCLSAFATATANEER